MYTCVSVALFISIIYSYKIYTFKIPIVIAYSYRNLEDIGI